MSNPPSSISIPSLSDIQQRALASKKKNSSLFRSSSSQDSADSVITSHSTATSNYASGSNSASYSASSSSSSPSASNYASLGSFRPRASSAALQSPAAPLPSSSPALSTSTPLKPSDGAPKELDDTTVEETPQQQPSPYAPFSRKGHSAPIPASPFPLIPKLSSLVSGSSNSKAAATPQPPAENPALTRAATAPIQGASTAYRILVNKNQEKNPVVKHIRNVPIVFEAIEPDYIVGKNAFGLFLSFKYHRLHPNYIRGRMKPFGKNPNQIRLLFALVDVEDPQATLTELHKISFENEYTLILSWSPEECGRYIETYKAYENKGPELIKGKQSQDFLPQLTEALTSVRSVNKTDVVTLASNFGSLKNLTHASISEIALCPGFGTSKAQKLHAALNEPFFPSKKPKLSWPAKDLQKGGPSES